MPSKISADPTTKTIEIRGSRFVIRELTIGEYDDLEKKATTKRPNPVNADAPEIEVVDRQQLLRMMVLKAVVEPHLTASKFADLSTRVALGLNDYVNKMHFPEEAESRADLVEIDPDEEDEEEETKGEG
jgi:hypothetical protein